MAAKTGNVWVFVEQEGGKIANVSLELVGKGRELADQLGVKTEVVLPGHGCEEAAQVLIHHGCDRVFLVDDPRLEPFTVLPYAKAIVDLVREHKPNILLFGATPVGRELAPRVASTLLAGLTADCTDLRIDDFDDKLGKQVYRNKLIVNTWEDPQMVTVRPGVMKLGEPNPKRRGEVVKIKPALTATETVVKVIERVRQEKSVDLQAAPVIVAGGYGVGSKENFALMAELARTLGGTVGASRAAVDAGWIDHDHQVGQTGVTVRPKLYIACGISGSVQHRAGMAESGKIIAINTDPEAPIFAIAHYGIVGEIKDVVPKLVKAFKAKI
jgi:electron transfer flavoprotein alpha subunit